MAAIMENNSAITTSVLFNLNDLGINLEYCYHYFNTTMQSEKYICIRELENVVIIDVTKPKQLIRLPITADYPAIMNPGSPILAFKVAANIDGTTQDQLKIFDVEANTTLKSYTIAEKVEYWKWITPKLLALVTLKAIYHWSTEGSTTPVKICDMTNELANKDGVNIRDYMHDPSEKWFALIALRIYTDDNYHLYIRPYHGEDQWLSFPAQRAAFINFNVEENHTPSTMFCWAREVNTYELELSVSEALVANSVSTTWFRREPDSGKKQSTISSNKRVYPRTFQISQKYGLIYVITRGGEMFIYELETIQEICSYTVSDQEIIHAIEGPSSGSFYSITKDGQVLLTNVNDSTILSFLQLTRGKLHDLHNSHPEMSSENEALKKQKAELQNESANIKGDLEESQIKMVEIEKQFSNMSTKIHNYLVSEKQMMNGIQQLETQKAEQQINKTEDLFTKLEKSFPEEIKKRQETEEQLASQRIKMLNEIKELKNEIAKLQNERDQLHVETNVQREIQLTSKMAELKNYQIPQEEMLKKLEQISLTVQNTNLINQNTELVNQNTTPINQNTEMINQNTNLINQNTELVNQNTTLINQNTELVNQNTTLINQNTELIKEKDKIIQNLLKSLQMEQDMTRETKQQLRIKKSEIENYKKSQEEMMKKIEDFRLLKESNNLEVNFIEYNHAELRRVTNDFNDSLKIGEGGYGPVYKAFIGLKPVAIKILKHESSHGNKQFTQEVKILSRVRHPNLVMLFGACQEAQALIYELLPNGSLYDILRNEQTRDALTSRIRICIASNICSALIVLHSAQPHGVVHGDLKSANILLDSNYMGKLSDFGICRYLEKTDSRNTAHHYTNLIKGTPAYWDPELFNAGEITVQCDVYAFGIILLELVTGRDSRGLRDQVEEALKKGGILVDASAGEWPLEEAKKMLQLGLRCSEFSRKNRPSLEKEVCPEIEAMLRDSLRF